MPYYDIYDDHDNLIASNVFIEDPIYGYSGGGDASGLFTTTMLIGYVLAFVGMIIMLFNVPTTMIFPAILGFLMYILIPLIGYFKCHSLIGVLGIIAKNSYLFLIVMVGMWWIMYSLQTVDEQLLIGILVTTMYSMYLIPGVLVYESIKLDTKRGIVFAVITWVFSLVIFLVNYDASINEPGIGQFYPIVLSTIITCLGSLFIYINRLCYSIQENKKNKGILSLVLYLGIILSVAITSFVVIPNNLEQKYNEAIECKENGDYKEARELLITLGRYSDASDVYETIKYKGLELGEKVIFGQYFSKPNDFYQKTNLTWTVIAIENGKAILFCDEIITSIDSNPLYRWKDGNNVKSKLSDIYDAFSDEDKKRIFESQIQYVTTSSTFTSKEKLFLLSEEELKKWCSEDNIYSKDDTKYNDLTVVGYMQSDFNYDYVYSYYVRGTNNKDEWIIVDCKNKQFITKNNRYVGIRPAVIINVD